MLQSIPVYTTVYTCVYAKVYTCVYATVLTCLYYSLSLCMLQSNPVCMLQSTPVCMLQSTPVCMLQSIAVYTTVYTCVYATVYTCLHYSLHLSTRNRTIVTAWVLVSKNAIYAETETTCISPKHPDMYQSKTPRHVSVQNSQTCISPKHPDMYQSKTPRHVSVQNTQTCISYMKLPSSVDHKTKLKHTPLSVTHILFATKKKSAPQFNIKCPQAFYPSPNRCSCPRRTGQLVD